MDHHAGLSAAALDDTISSRAPALRLVPTPTSRAPAAVVWTDICSGTLRVVELRQEARETLVFLQRRTFSASAAVLKRRRAILESVLQGTSECAIAIDLQLAASTVSQELKQALVSLGLDPRLSALPLPLAQLYHAAVSHRSLELSAAGPGDANAATLVVRLPRPELELDCLAPTERVVCQLVLSGKTHDQIAAIRGRSARTVANQLASIFAKLHVSGRLELVSHLAAWPSGDV